MGHLQRYTTAMSQRKVRMDRDMSYRAFKRLSMELVAGQFRNRRSSVLVSTHLDDCRTASLAQLQDRTKPAE